MRIFEVEALGMGFNNKGYPGAFTKPIEDIIKSITNGKKILHLYSGSSFIGDVRVDLEHENATVNKRVEDYCESEKNNYDFILLDPPYAITRRKKIDAYAETASLSSDVKWRNKIKDFLRRHTNNILWLDYCAPSIKGFRRKKIWLFLPGGYHNVRVLSWLEKEMDLLL